MLEVNISAEVSKDGFSLDLLRSHWDSILEYKAIDIIGLMAMAPFSPNSEQARQVFSDLREARDHLQSTAMGRVQLKELSMGMSNDFEIAIEEGATMIRVGSKLYEGLA